MQKALLVISTVFIVSVVMASCKQSSDPKPDPKKATSGTPKTTSDSEQSTGGGSGYSPADPGGIPNVGNTCYLNASMQITSKLYPDTFKNGTAKYQTLGQRIVEKIEKDTEGVDYQTANDFYSAYLETGGKGFGHKSGAQEDAFESLTFLLGWMNNHTPTATLSRVFGYDEAQKQRFNVGKTPDNPMREEQFSVLSVPLGDGSQTMSEFVNGFLGANVEKRTLQEKATHNLVEEGLQTTSYSLTNLENLKNNILPIKLIRYAFRKDAANVKLHTVVKDPMMLTIRTALSEGQEVSYELIGFIFHEGATLKRGHYIAYIKRDNKTWKCYNDGSVSKVRNEEVVKGLAGKAYMYFYQRSSS